MTQQLTGVLVLIASPSDTMQERATVREQLVSWNINNGRRQNVSLQPWLYESSAVPTLGDRGQAIINSQAVDQADVVVAFFDSRLGTHTGVDVSGTAEEIRRAHEAGKPVHVYFSTADLARDYDRKQYEALEAFKQELKAQGLLGSYSDPSDLAGQVVRALESDIDLNGWSNTTGQSVALTPAAADLRWSHDHRKEQKGIKKNGSVDYRILARDLVVTNEGAIPAESLTFTVTAVGEDQRFAFNGPEEPVTVEGHSTLSWKLIPLYRMNVVVDAKWIESGEEKSRRWTVAVS